MEPFGIPQVGHEEIYKSCDIITLHVPLDESTQNMIHKETFENFRPESILINTARGGLVNELDLQEALKSGPLLGAAMDVFEEEPNTTHPLFQLPNFFPTPHISGNSNQAILNMGRSAIEHLRNFFSKDSQWSFWATGSTEKLPATEGGKKIWWLNLPAAWKKVPLPTL